MEVCIMAIVLLMTLGIGVLVVLAFFVFNSWSSPDRDHEKSAALRTHRQMAGTEHESRGIGIN
jgi:hypothetical protein